MNVLERELANDEKWAIFNALEEAIAAIGDIPAENASNQQQEAYRLCMEVRDKLYNERKER